MQFEFFTAAHEEGGDSLKCVAHFNVCEAGMHAELEARRAEDCRVPLECFGAFC